MFIDKLRRQNTTATEKKFIKQLDTKGTDINQAAKVIKDMYDLYYNEIGKIVNSSGWASGEAKKKLSEFLTKRQVLDYFTRRTNPEVVDAIILGRGPLRETLRLRN